MANGKLLNRDERVVDRRKSVKERKAAEDCIISGSYGHSEECKCLRKPQLSAGCRHKDTQVTRSICNDCCGVVEQEQIQSVPGLHRHFIPATCSTWSAGATVNHVTISSPGHPDPSRAVADRGHDETRGDSTKHGEAGKWSPVLTSFVSSMLH
ncbi:hypothetical protein Q7C36_008263 [Tachysurus vachellii]|uniref:Uncharacterized protein n=1 Tax=Tachysurus vachellii TaxID=175792 RepID=A0AA88NA18_TACVA|nr:hypothetical protein Q7C36_008263 [Tachysurus vachellii]